VSALVGKVYFALGIGKNANVLLGFDNFVVQFEELRTNTYRNGVTELRRPTKN
jgi:hypothetical protein